MNIQSLHEIISCSIKTFLALKIGGTLSKSSMNWIHFMGFGPVLSFISLYIIAIFIISWHNLLSQDCTILLRIHRKEKKISEVNDHTVPLPFQDYDDGQNCEKGPFVTLSMTDFII